MGEKLIASRWMMSLLSESLKKILKPQSKIVMIRNLVSERERKEGKNEILDEEI